MPCARSAPPCPRRWSVSARSRRQPSSMRRSPRVPPHGPAWRAAQHGHLSLGQLNSRSCRPSSSAVRPHSVDTCCAAMAAARISSPTTPVGTAIARSARAARPSAGSLQEDAASRSEQARTCAMPAIVCGPATPGDGGSESGLPPLGVGIRRRTTNEPHLHVVKRIELSRLNEQRSVSSAKACQCFAKVDALSPN